MEQQMIDQESVIQELQLGLHIEASMMTELVHLEFWERQVHSQMYHLNPRMMGVLFENNRLRQYLAEQQELLSEAARELEKAYRLQNPISQEASYLDRAAWMNQAKSFAAETLLSELSSKMSSWTEEQTDPSQQS